MITHIELGGRTFKASRKINQLVHNGLITLGGNKKLKIYGTLNCTSGKRMKAENRVFFVSKIEAGEYGYRPCGHCMREKYQIWKQSQQQKSS
jgi:hypothetical protein